MSPAVIDLASSRVRIVRVIGDGMEPTLRPHRDLALCRPVHAYQGEGIYLLSDMAGGETFYRVDAFCGRVRLLLDNPAYGCGGGEIGLDEFNTRVLAIVLAEIRGRVSGDWWEALR